MGRQLIAQIMGQAGRAFAGVPIGMSLVIGWIPAFTGLVILGLLLIGFGLALTLSSGDKTK